MNHIQIDLAINSGLPPVHGRLYSRKQSSWEPFYLELYELTETIDFLYQTNRDRFHADGKTSYSYEPNLPSSVFLDENDYPSSFSMVLFPLVKRPVFRLQWFVMAKMKARVDEEHALWY